MIPTQVSWAVRFTVLVEDCEAGLLEETGCVGSL